MKSKLIVEQMVATVQGHYLLDIPSGSAPDSLLVGFHGYGENAEQNLEHLSQIPSSRTWLRCSIQALHPFYNRKTGQVVASWMTRLDRERAIEHNVAYVGNVIRRIRSERNLTRIVYSGFSQGVAMAYRAACLSGHPYHGLIILAGDFPPDLETAPIPQHLPILLARGKYDTWYTQEKMDADLELLEPKGAALEPLVFDGDHEWSPEFLEAADKFLRRLLRE